jgi:tetratricopeptide (TPR) repeat protein
MPIRSIDRFRRARWFAVVCATSVALVGQTIPENLPNLAQIAKRSVVTIYASGGRGGPLQGSGFFVSSDGLILTNRHVVEGSATFRVVLYDETELHGVRLAYTDKVSDLALLVAAVSVDDHLPLGNREPQIGEWIFVIGSPLGLSQSVTDGIVSAVRTVGPRRLIQVTAPISHGSSGSPVMNSSGVAVGVATESYVEGQGLNFAEMTANIAKVVEQLGGPIPDESVRSVGATRSVGPSASQVLEKIKQQPLELELYQELAQVYERDREPDHAIESLRLGVQLNPGVVRGYEYLSNLYSRLKRNKDAVATLEQGLERIPDSRSLKRRLAGTLSISGDRKDLERAATLYNENIRDDKDDVQAYMGRAAVLPKLGQRAEAISLYRQVVERWPDSRNAYYELSLLLEQKDAIAAFTDYSARFPQEPYVKYILGKVLTASGNRAEALRIYEKLRTQDTSLSEALFRLILPARP